MTTPAIPRLAEATAILERTPASLGALCRDLPEAWIMADEGPGTWTPRDVVGHLLHTERVNWMPRLRHILRDPSIPFPPLDRTAQADRDMGVASQLAAFSDLRRGSLSELAGMDLHDSDLGRASRHPELGLVTVGQLLATWVVHDLDHLAQIARVMAKRYAHSTGPWSAYLSILRDRPRT